MSQKIRRRTKQMMSLLLATVMFISECNTGYAAKETNGILGYEEADFQEETGSEDVIQETLDQETLAQEPKPHVLFEMEDLREQSTKQYRLSDGTVLAAQYAMDVHYETEEGKWSEIDNRFLYEAAENGEDFDGYTTSEGAVEFKFAPQVQDGEILRISEGDHSVGFQMLAPEVEEDSAEEIPEITDVIRQIILYLIHHIKTGCF